MANSIFYYPATPCFGSESCWILAFGLPAILMIISIVVFVAGTKLYTRVPVTESVALKFCKVLYYAVVRKVTGDRSDVDHWLDRAVGGDISVQFHSDLYQLEYIQFSLE